MSYTGPASGHAASAMGDWHVNVVGRSRVAGAGGDSAGSGNATMVCPIQLWGEPDPCKFPPPIEWGPVPRRVLPDDPRAGPGGGGGPRFIVDPPSLSRDEDRDLIADPEPLPDSKGKNGDPAGRTGLVVPQRLAPVQSRRERDPQIGDPRGQPPPGVSRARESPADRRLPSPLPTGGDGTNHLASSTCAGEVRRQLEDPTIEMRAVPDQTVDRVGPLTLGL